MWNSQISKYLCLTINLFNFFTNAFGIFYSLKLFKWKIETWFIVETLYLMEDSLRNYFWNKVCTALFWDNNKTCTKSFFMHFWWPVHYRQWLSFPSGFKPNLLEKGIVSWIILSFDLLENPYVGLGVPLSPISMRIFEI